MSKALFLDRDGIINVDHGYIYKPQDIMFVTGIFELCHFFKQKDYKLIVVTNQSGIGRGFYTESQFHRLSDWMADKFKQQGLSLDDIFFCPHHPTAGLGEYKQDCECRKPNPGMLLAAAEKHKLDLQQCIMVGDKRSDMQAAQRAGLSKAYWVINDTTSLSAAPISCHLVADLQAIIEQEN